ncbi:MAG: dihydrolipoyl dehydrogenase [Parachlamydiales bacterium]|nr:dihydrolipoyl dehydrogenase [Parachlamydiales bacterium]
MQKKTCDIAIIGAGPGGYTAAIRASQLGSKVILIDKLFVGGVCLNTGCIPTKSLLTCADALDIVKKSAQFGVETKDISFDLSKMIDRKDLIINGLRNSLKNLLLANKIEILQGTCSFETDQTIKVEGHDSCIIEAKKTIIATGSSPQEIPNIEIDRKLIHNSNSLLNLKKLPSSLVVIGGGYIGCEFTSFYARLGVKVTIIEALPSILYSHGKEIADLLSKTFLKQNVSLETNVKVKSIEKTQSSVKVILENEKIIEADIALIAIGRKVNTKGLNLENLNINTDQRKEILVNDQMQTSNKNIYAVGDVLGKWMLAHTASHEALVAVDTIHGIENKMSFDAVPAIIFTKPEIATVGLTEEKAKEKNIEVEVGKFPFSALGKAHASSEKDGFVKIMIDKKTKRILGAGAIGPSASILIAQMGLAITNNLTADSIIETIHAHPTLAESWLEATLISQNRPLNFPPNLKI